jgi:hypothetical protein
MAKNHLYKYQVPNGQSLEQAADYVWVFIKILSADCLRIQYMKLDIIATVEGHIWGMIDIPLRGTFL